MLFPSLLAVRGLFPETARSPDGHPGKTVFLASMSRTKDLPATWRSTGVMPAAVTVLTLRAQCSRSASTRKPLQGIKRSAINRRSVRGVKHHRGAKPLYRPVNIGIVSNIRADSNIYCAANKEPARAG